MGPCASSRAAAPAASHTLCSGGHQANVITSRWTGVTRSRIACRALATGGLLKVHARRVFARCVVDYQIEPENPTLHHPQSGEHRLLDKEISAVRPPGSNAPSD